MPITCSSCGTQNPDGFRFCGACGTALEPDAPEGREVRKTVTVLFCDVAGSTGLAERLDPEALRRVMSGYFDEMRRILERHGGTVEKFIGDAVFAVFGVPVAHEDDALRAVRAAAEMLEAARQIAVPGHGAPSAPLSVRIGVNTGTVLAGGPSGGGGLVTGDAVNIAARLQQRAEPGQILLGGATLRLVRDAVEVEAVGELAVRGRDGTVAAVRLLSVDRDAPGHQRRLDAPLVARDRELAQLRDAFESADSDRACVMFTVLGSAGVGKSRLVHEFVAGIAERATVLRGRCLPYGEGITWWPVAETVRAAAGIAESDDAAVARARISTLLEGTEHADLVSDRVAAVLGLADAAGGGEETMWALRRVYEQLAAQRSLVLIFDDIHWGEPTFLDLIEHVADWSRDAPILLLCIARPELLEERPNWGGGKLRARTVLLEPLSVDAVGRLVEHLVSGRLDAGVVARLAEAAEGNPLFVEEFLEMLVDDGLLQRDGTGWTATRDLANVAIPPTVAALLSSRLDRLRGPERAVVERASVMGRTFWRGAVEELAPQAIRRDLDRHLLALVRKELVRPEDTRLPGDVAYRFRHLLVRDAAYDSLPKEDRADLHVRFADWLERIAADRVAEYEEVIGYHLEQAHRYRRELGDDSASAPALRAGAILGRAGRRAALLGDIPAASALLARAAALLPETSIDRASVLTELIDASVEAGRFAEARALCDEVEALGRDRPELERFVWVARVHRRLADILGEAASGAFASVLPLLDEAAERLTALGDDHGLAITWGRRGQILLGMGRLAEAADASRRALLHAERAGAARLRVDAATQVAATDFYAMTPIPQAIASMDRLVELARSVGSRMSEARAQAFLGRLAALDGRFEEGWQLCRAGVQAIDELGRPLYAGGSRHWTGLAAVIAEDWRRAEGEYEESVRLLEKIGERSYLSTSLAELAHTRARLGRMAEARALAERSLEVGADDDVATQSMGRLALAIATAPEDPHRAAAVVREALRIADGAEYTIERYRVRIGAAMVLAAAGERSEALALVDQAEALAVAREATALAATARRTRESIESGRLATSR